MTITVDTSDAKEAIKTIRKAQRQAKKDEARKSVLRGVALQRAESAAFTIVRAASSDYLVGWSVYRPDPRLQRQDWAVSRLRQRLFR